MDRVEAREWISWFWHEAVVRENSKSRSTRLAQPKPFVTPIAAVQFPMPAFSQNDAKWGFTHLPFIHDLPAPGVHPPQYCPGGRVFVYDNRQTLGCPSAPQFPRPFFHSHFRDRLQRLRDRRHVFVQCELLRTPFANDWIGNPELGIEHGAPLPHSPNAFSTLVFRLLVLHISVAHNDVRTDK